MKFLTVGIIIFIYICSYNIAAAELGDACTVGANDNCTDTGQKCAVSGTCACDTASNYNYDGSKCVIELGSFCSGTLPCNDADISCESGSCKCNSGFYDDNGVNTPGGSCVQKHGLGESCTSLNSGTVGPDQCNTDHAECDLDTVTCQCITGYTSSVSGCTNINDCDPDPCKNSGVCTDGINDYTCNCDNTGFTDKNCQTNINDCDPDPCKNGGVCTDGINDYTCNCDNTGFTDKNCQTNIDDCTPNPCLNGGSCTDGINDFTCACKSGFSSNRCNTAALGASCSVQGTSCEDTNSECGSGTMCVCKNSYYDNDGTNNIGGTCRQKVVVGGICPSPTTAVPKTATCSDSIAACELDGSDYRCLCPSTHYDDNGVNVNGGECESKKRLGEVCPRTSAIGERDTCIDSNARCRYSGGSYKCLCADTHYDSDGTSNIGGTCISKVGLGEDCPQADACKTSQSKCSSSQKCVCKSSYYDTNGADIHGGQCSLKVGLGYSCPMPDACQSSRAECTGSTVGSVCICKAEYYDDNTDSTRGGTCRDIEQLQVTGISFSNIQTTQFTVSWTPPAGKDSYISGYAVEWSPIDNSEDGDSRNVSSGSQQTLTGLTPGRTYEVKVISKNTATQPGSTRSTSSKKDQAAEPKKPGTVTSTLNDLDARDGSITIRWGTSGGVATKYRVKLIDGNTEVTNTTSTSSTAVIGHSTLKDGYIYTVNIEARSQSYDGNYLWSEKRISTIKTKVQVPDPPRNGFCKDPTDKSITLEWSKPADTKGDLVNYHIHVYQDYNTVKFIVSTAGAETQKTVGNLDPGTSYTFRIFTENEMYNASSSNNVTTGCKTKAKMSEAPTNLDISNVTSHSFDISWMKPTETHSAENYGYVLQIKDDQDKCVTEIIYKCSNCTGSFQISNLTGLCSVAVRTELSKSKLELEGQFTYAASKNLNPDIAYTVTVTAINDAGRGYPASETERTLEEAPKAPYDVAVSEIGTTFLNVTWKIDGPRPGKTLFTIELMADNPAETQEFTISGFDRREYQAQDLQEYWNYSVTVKAATSVGEKTSERTQEYTTEPAAPGEVSAFKITEAPGKNYTVMMITWKAPGILERNSIIKTYSFEHYATGKVTTTKDFSQESFEDHVYTVMLDVTPEKTYTLSVYAVNDKGQKGKNITREQTAPAGVPINIEDTLGVEIIPKDLLKNKEQRRFTISLVPEFFTEQTYGIPQGTGLAACAKNCDFTGIQTLQYFDSMDNWNKASVNGFELWRITNSTFLDVLKKKQGNSRRKRSTTQLDYTVGSDDCSQVQQGEYCNGPLQPGTSYIIVAVSCTSGGCLVSKEYGPFVTLAVPDDDDNLPMIIGIVVAVVVVVIIGAVVGFVLFRKKRSGPGKMKPASESDDDEFTTIDPAVAKIPRKRPIVLEEIEEYVNKMHKDSNLLFSAEYEDLKTLSPKHACEAADREENRMRNRYINIIPFDHTRVKLSTNGEDDSSDYINANYLPGYSSPREYIGCQGPIPGTIDDFWRMTWEQNVSVVVMLTLCKEGQKIKCEQYWPDEVGEPKQYGDVIVEITSYSNIRTYDYRMFKITNGSTTRVVKHFHFLSWLDFQANVHHDIILDFIQHVRQHVQPPDTSGPMIIHCSAGVGRTGTYIALDHLMQFINEHDFAVEIDIFDLVLKLRENRQHMVQTEQQYVFIHDCVKEIMDRKRRQMENIYENQAFLEKLNAAQDENIYQNEQSLYENVSQAKSEQNTEL